MTPNDVFFMLREGLRKLDNDVTDFIQSQGIFPAPGSQAANERATFSRREPLETASAIASMLIESVGEHAAVLVRSMTEPIAPFACWTNVRSMLESASISAWLHDPKVDARQRVGRSFAHQFEGLEEQLKFGRAARFQPDEVKKLKDLVEKLVQDAVLLGFDELFDSKHKRIGIAERMPSATDIIKLVLDEECAYRLLSAVAHAHTWAMLHLCFSRATDQLPQPGEGDRLVLMEKTVGGLEQHAYSVVRATKALAVPVWNYCLYFGWDKERLVGILESVYDQMKMQPETRFWR